MLAVLGSADLLATIYLLARGDAVEANPMMGRVFRDFGPAGFCAAKAILLGGPLAVAELARSRHERFVVSALRFASVAYAVALIVAYVPRIGRLLTDRS
jgi:hypothetical protein